MAFRTHNNHRSRDTFFIEYGGMMLALIRKIIVRSFVILLFGPYALLNSDIARGETHHGYSHSIRNLSSGLADHPTRR